MTDVVVLLTDPEAVIVNGGTASAQVVIGDGVTAPVIVGQQATTVVEVGLAGGGSVGPPGPSGFTGTEFTQTVPAATWIIPIPAEFTRRPAVTLYDEAGEQVEADIFTSSDYVTVQFPAPFAGTAVLN